MPQPGGPQPKEAWGYEKRRCIRCGEEKGGSPYRFCRCQREEHGLGDRQPHTDAEKVHECAERVVSLLLNDAFSTKEVAMGRKVENEHTADPKKAEKIAKEHLREPGHSRYYTRLKKCGLADELKS